MRIKWIIIIVLIFVGITTFFIFNKPHRNISKEEIDYSVSSDDIFSEFLKNANTANQKYLDKIVMINGNLIQINHINNQYFLLIGGKEAVVHCEMTQESIPLIIGLKESENVNIKGLFIGFDDLLQEIQLKKCVVIN